MITIDRTTVITGPCVITYSGSTLYSEGDVTVTPQKTVFGINTSRFGKNTDQRLKDVFYKVAFTPSGEVTTALLAIYFPYAGFLPGTSIFGANDVPLVIISLTGERYTFRNAALSKMPDIALKADKVPFGAVEFSCIGGKAMAYNAANRFVTIDSTAYPADTYSNANVITTPYSGRFADTIPTGATAGSGASPDVFTSTAHGLVVGDTILHTGFANTVINGLFTVHTVPSPDTYTLYQLGTTTVVNGDAAAEAGGTFTRQNPLDLFDTEDGFDVTFGLTLTPRSTDNCGLYDMLFSSMEVTVKGQPVGPTPTQMLAAMNTQGSTVRRGQSMQGEGHDFYASGSGLYFKATKAFIKDGPWMYGTDKNRLGDVTWMSTRTFTTGVANPLFAISTMALSS